MTCRFESEIRFLTPAFLGDAFQRARWRTPPFKALLREWWRIAVAERHEYDWEKLREAEGRLFGHAFLKHEGKTWASRSRVDFRLIPWSPGTLRNWSAFGTVHHPEVRIPIRRNRQVVGHHNNIESSLYLGFGPLVVDRRTGARVARPPAISAGENARLAIQPVDGALSEAVKLVHAFGTIGSRRHNGWGSLALERHESMTFDDMRGLAEHRARPLEDCLQLDWPHAFGLDPPQAENGGEEQRILIWKTRETFTRWQDAMRELARVKIEFRTALRWSGSPPGLNDRHILAYPVTNHQVAGLSQERLANQLRFKVLRDGGGFRGLVYHLPHKVPVTPKNESLHGKFSPHDPSGVLARQLDVWRDVHRTLDRVMTRL